MHPPRFRLRTLMMLVWLSALVLAGAADVLQEQRNRHRVQIIETGPSTSTILYGHSRYYYLGPVPIGSYPIAVACGVAFVASIGVWKFYRRDRNRT